MKLAYMIYVYIYIYYFVTSFNYFNPENEKRAGCHRSKAWCAGPPASSAADSAAASKEERGEDDTRLLEPRLPAALVKSCLSCGFMAVACPERRALSGIATQISDKSAPENSQLPCPLPLLCIFFSVSQNPTKHLLQEESVGG